MNKEKRRVPKLRFPGFTEDWEQRKLDEVCNVYDGTHQTPRYTNSGVMFVSVEDIETLESNKYITEEDFKSEFKVFPEYGDILLTRIGDVGSANVILDEIKRAYYVSLALLKPKNINSLFLLALLGSSSVQSEIWRRTLHIAFPKKINKNEINKVIVKQPSIPEQEKIGKLFFSLDQTITLHQRKLEHLILKKKALLQKLFPKNGERYPELRFSEFTDAWEQRKFKDLFIERREKTIRENEETLLSCAITGIYLNSELFSHFRGSSTIGYLKIKKYDLILSAQNLHLGNANINLSFDKGMISPAYKVFELKSIDPYFINAWVKKDSTKNFFLKATTEGASQCRKNIEWDVLLNQEIPVPNKLEQRAIGRFINNIDMIITLHQRKLEHLQLQKKALLQQMFV